MNGKAEKTAESLPESIYLRYWKAYGGLCALVTSGYFWTSVVVTLCLFNLWTNQGWWDPVLSIMPNLLGFSLGGFALWLAIGDDGFRKEISSKDNEEQYSIYTSINASFVHFIMLQILAITCALLAKSFDFVLPADSWPVKYFGNYYYSLCTAGAFIGFFLFVYALFSALAATMGLFQITFMYEHFLNAKKSDECSCGNKKT